MKINVIVSVAEAKNVVNARAIGFKGNLLCSLAPDMKRFRELTFGSAVIMGRKTWESLPDKYRPLPFRQNIVITSDRTYQAKGATVVHSYQDALKAVETPECYVIGGERVYEEALSSADTILMTMIFKEFDADAFFPAIPNPGSFEIEYSQVMVHDNIGYCYKTYRRAPQ